MEVFVQQLINGLTLGSIYGLIAIGYTMVFGIIGMVNFAHGDVFMVGAFLGYYAATYLNLQEQPTLGAALIALLPVLLVTMVACALLGFLIERLAYRPLRRAPRLTGRRGPRRLRPRHRRPPHRLPGRRARAAPPR